MELDDASVRVTIETSDGPRSAKKHRGGSGL
jgi:hypothetical protein